MHTQTCIKNKYENSYKLTSYPTPQRTCNISPSPRSRNGSTPSSELYTETLHWCLLSSHI